MTRFYVQEHSSKHCLYIRFISLETVVFCLFAPWQGIVFSARLFAGLSSKPCFSSKIKVSSLSRHHKVALSKGLDKCYTSHQKRASDRWIDCPLCTRQRHVYPLSPLLLPRTGPHHHLLLLRQQLLFLLLLDKPEAIEKVFWRIVWMDGQERFQQNLDPDRHEPIIRFVLPVLLLLNPDRPLELKQPHGPSSEPKALTCLGDHEAAQDKIEPCPGRQQ